MSFLVRSGTLVAAFTLASKIAQELQRESPVLDNPQAIVELLREQNRTKNVETFQILLVNTRRRLIRVEQVSQGLLDTILVHPREVFNSAIAARAAAIVLVHNHPSGDPTRQKELAGHARFLVRRSLELIRDESTLNVRILTRSPLARADFDLFHSFGKRLVFGMSLPTLRNDLSKIYEPKAPAPSQRFATLQAAKKAGLHVYVAMAPTYPECDEADLRATLKAVAELDPITIFHEPINIRAENVARIKAQAAKMGVILQTEVFATRESWQNYAVNALHTVCEVANELGIKKHLHLWPDKSLGSQALAERMPKPNAYLKRLEFWWNRVSEWPK